MITRALSLAMVPFLFWSGVLAQSPSSSGADADKKIAALPHDRHEGLTISADPYTDRERSKQKFGKASPNEIGILPVEVFLRNETGQAMRVKLESVQLDVHMSDGSHQDIDWLTPAEVANYIAHPGGAKTPGQRRMPLPLPTNDKKAENLLKILGPLTLDDDVVPPMGMVHGFLFFNVNHEMSLAARSTLYAPDVVAIPTNKPLLFFEVPLGTATD